MELPLAARVRERMEMRPEYLKAVAGDRILTAATRGCPVARVECGKSRKDAEDLQEWLGEEGFTGQIQELRPTTRYPTGHYMVKVKL